MQQDTKDKMQSLTNALADMQTKVVGYFKIYNQYEPIIEIDGDTVITLTIGKMFGVSRTFYDNSAGSVILFPDNKTLPDMMSDGLYFHDWVVKNNIK